MARLIMWNIMTLDGYIEGPCADISWHEKIWGPELEALSIEQGRAAGALIFGRKTYDLMAGYWPAETGEIADFMNALPKIVFSRTMKEPGWKNVRLFSDNPAETIERLKGEYEKDIFVFGSAHLASQITPLFDELRIGVAPFLLGAGAPLFKPGATAQFSLVDSRAHSTGLTLLRYAPDRREETAQ